MHQRFRPHPAVCVEGTAGVEMERRVREFDWASHPLGPRERWPASLRIAVDLCLRCRSPMNVLWGPDLVQIYNDAYRPMLGADKHPAALGQPVRECWREAACVIGPLLDDVVATGRSCWFEDRPIVVHRDGFDEQACFTFSYSPIEDEGAVRGVLVAVNETTAVVLGRRRQSILHDIAFRLADVRTRDEACGAVGAVLRSATEDVPSAALYLVDGEAGTARLCVGEGVGGGLPVRLRTDVPEGSAIGRAVASMLSDPDAALCVDLPQGPDGGSPLALLLPVRLAGRDRVAGALMLGTNPRIRLDASYREFLYIVGSHVAAAFTRVNAHDEERRRVAARAALAEQKRAELELRRQALVFETVSEAVVITDAEGRVIDCNAAAERMVGRPRAALIGRPFDRDVAETPGDLDERERRALADRDGIWAGEVAFVHAQRGRQVADETVVPQRNAAGRPVAFIRVAREVTERKRTEEWADGQRRILEHIAAGRPVAGALDHLASLIERQLPPASCSILRCESGRLWLGAAPSLPASLLPGVDGVEVGPFAGPCGAAAFYREPVLATARPFGDDVGDDADAQWPQYQALARAHGIRSTWSTPILDPEGSVLGTFALSWRVEHGPTEPERLLVNDAVRLAGIAIARHLAEQGLRRQAVVFETLSEAVLLADAEGRVTAWNPAMEALTGFTRAEMLGKQPRITHVPGLRHTLLEEVLAAAARGSEWSAELPFVRKDGTVRIGEVKVVADRDREGRMVGVVGIARDITDRRQAEDALRGKNEQLAAIVQMQHAVAMSPLDSQAVTRRIAAWAAQLTGADGAAVGVPDGDEIVLVAAHGRFAQFAGTRFPQATSLSGRCLAAGQPLRVDDVQSDDGCQTSLKATGVRAMLIVPLIYDQRRIGALAIGAARLGAFNAHDTQALTLAGGLLAAAMAHSMAFEAKRRLIGERTTALAALERSEEHLRALSECSPDGMFAADVAGRCMYVNRRFTELLDLPAEEFLGDGWQRHVHPEDRADFVEAWDRATAAGTAVSREMRFVRAEHGTVVVHIRSAPLVLASGELVGFVGTCQDVTDRREAEYALRRAERQYRELVESVDAIVWRAAGTPARMTFVSQQVETVLGVRPADLVGQPRMWGELIHPDDREAVRAKAAAAQRSRVTVQHEFRAQTIDGRELWLRSLMRRTPDYAEPGEIIGVTFDVTELRDARESLARSRQELRNFATELQTIREEERTRISREIHDELGQALTGLKLEAAWLRTKLPKTATRLLTSADTMIDQIDGTIETVRRLATELRPHVLDSLGLVAALEWQVREFERRAKIRCTLSVEGKLPEPSVERSTAVFRIVQEALTNVARHACAANVAVTVAGAGAQLVVTVHDDGRGIPADAANGTGSLGILGMRERAIACGGQLDIVPDSKTGTLVTVYVPLDHNAAAMEMAG